MINKLWQNQTEIKQHEEDAKRANSSICSAIKTALKAMSKISKDFMEDLLFAYNEGKENLVY